MKTKKIINFKIADKIAKNTTPDVYYVCGNKDYIIEFDFDEEWSAEQVRTAHFKYSNTYVDVDFTGNRCPVPQMFGIKTFTVGVYTDNLCTTGDYVVCKASVRCDTANLVPPSSVPEDRLILEYERDIPYHDQFSPEYGSLPTTVALDRTHGDTTYDIINIVISGYVEMDDGRACYFNQDITRQVQGVGSNGDSGSFKMAGILSHTGSDNLSMYDFKVDVKIEGEKFLMKTERLVLGESFEGRLRHTKGKLTHVKVRSILANHITVL